MNIDKIKFISISAILSSVYVALTWINPLSYGMFQLRISGILSVLPLMDRKYAQALLIGVAIANLFSPLGLIDVAVGLIIGIIAYYGIPKRFNIYLKCFIYSLIAGLLVGLELYYVALAPFLYSFLSVGGSMVVVMFIGVPICKTILKGLNKQLIKI